MGEEIAGFGLVAVVGVVSAGPHMRRPTAVDAAFADIDVDLAVAPQVDVVGDRIGPDLLAFVE